MVYLFLTLAHNDRAYAHLRFAGAFTFAKRKSECGSKTAGMHVSQQVSIAYVMWSFFLSFCYDFCCFGSYSNSRNRTTIKFQKVSFNSVTENYTICRH